MDLLAIFLIFTVARKNFFWVVNYSDKWHVCNIENFLNFWKKWSNC
jgi:hypothetical protein